MNVSKGLQNEDNFVYEIHNKKFKDIAKNLQFFIQYMFPHVKDSDTIYCFKTEDYIKPDVCIQWHDQNAFVSLKFGVSDTIHGESLLTFCDFLKSIGLDNESINTIKLFTFGDGTTDGSGLVRKSGIEVRYSLRNQIASLNEKLNQNKEFVKAVVNRVLFKGVNPQAYEAQYVYHGSVEYGDFVSKNQVMKHINRKNWDFMDCPHIGPIVFRPHARYADKEILNDKFRYELKFTWPNLLPDIRYIAQRYNW